MILGIYGSGGLGREVLDLARSIDSSDVVSAWAQIVFINDFKEENEMGGAKVFTFDEFKAAFSPDNAKIVIAVGEPDVRRILREKVSSASYALSSLISPTAFVSEYAKVGNGAIIQHGCFISCGVELGESVLVQPNANVGHDSIIGKDCVISSFVTLAGVCKVGERTYLGMSVPVREHVSIGSDAIAGMGACVFRDIPDGVIAIGNPARVMKNNDEKRVFK